MNKDQVNKLLAAMLDGANGLSDLLFIPGRPAQTTSYGRLHPYTGDLTEPILTPQFAEQLAALVIDGNALLTENLQKHGSCDCSYAIPEVARFRVHVYRQNGQLAVVMRKLSNEVPALEKLGLPPVLNDIIKENSGLVFVTGATGVGKTTT